MPQPLETAVPKKPDFKENNYSFLVSFTYQELIEKLKLYQDDIKIFPGKYKKEDITLDDRYRDIKTSLDALEEYGIIEKKDTTILPNQDHTFCYFVRPIKDEKETNLADFDKETNLAKFDNEWIKRNPPMKTVRDSSNTEQASTPNQRIEFNIPNSSNIFASRRKTPLAKIKNELEECQFLVITGVKGFGKTEIAVQYYCKYRDLYPGGIFWIDAQTNLSSKFKLFIRKLTENNQEYQDSDFQINECWNHWRQLNKGRKLIIVDDVLDFNGIRNYLPNLEIYKEFHVILTSHQKLFVGKKILELIPLEWEESIYIIYEHFQRADIDTSRLDNASKEEKQELCELLMNCPLTIHMVAIYLIRHEHLSLQDLTSRFRERGIKHVSLSIDKSSSSIRYQHETLEIALTFIYDLLTEDAQRLGCLLGMLSYSPINLDFFRNIKIDLTIDEERLEEILAELIENHFLPKRDDNGTYRNFELIHSFFREKLNERIENNDTLIKENVQMLVNDVVEISKRIVLEYESSERRYFDSEQFRFYIEHIAEIGINNLGQVSPDDVIYPLISYLIVYNNELLSRTSRKDDNNQQRPAPIKLFSSLIQRLCEIDEPTNIICECFDRLFIFYDFQQYLYDTESLQVLVNKFEQLSDKVNSWDGHPKAEATFFKLLGHGLYAYSEFENQKKAVRFLVRVADIAEIEKEKQGISNDEKIVWNLFLLAMLDHASHTMFKANNDIDTNSIVFDTSSKMIDRLNYLYGSVELTFPLSQLPSARATPYILRAAHYQGHFGNQCLIKLYSDINRYLCDSNNINQDKSARNKREIEHLYLDGIEYYLSSVHLRVINLYMAFPGIRFLSLEKDFPKSLREVDSYNEWIIHVINDNHRFKYEHFTNISQAIGDIGQQYRGIATVMLWYCMFKVKCGDSDVNRILDQAQHSLRRSRSLWKLAQKTLYGDVLIKYYLKIVSTKQIYVLLISYLKNGFLPKLNEILRKTKSEFDDIERKYKISDSHIKRDNIEKICLFYDLLSMDFIS
ncbi:MAG: NB-ARC domain-containing protein [Cyanobacteria bacterium P01_F01_bin.143]